MERDVGFLESNGATFNFNSHAHVERDAYPVFAFDDKNGISTHTLTWSVTKKLGTQYGLIRISTHTLTWSVTPYWKTMVKSIRISTHTLTWSVTFFSPSFPQR